MWKGTTAGAAQQQQNSMKDRLAGYFILVTGFSLLVCLFTLVFHTAYGYQYKTAIQRLILLNTFSEDLDQMNENVQFYARYEDDGYYEMAQSYIGKMQEALTAVYGEEHELALLRQIQDVAEITEALGKELLSIHTEHNPARKGDTFQAFHQKLEEIENVGSSLGEEAKILNRMELSYLDSAYVQMEKRSRQFNRIFVVIFLMIFLCMFFQIQGFSRAISRPIYALIQKAEQIGSNGLREVAPIVISGRMIGEIKLLTEVFNDMVGQLKQQIEMVEENARVHRLLQESKFKELQMQINPHFLFNILNMIADNAYMEHAERTEQLLLSAARMFRFSLDFSGKPVPLFREIEELGNYVFIQEQRYGEKILFEFELDEVFHHVKIPSLILQPLVENAIIHGVDRQKGKAKILIKTCYCPEEACGYISVADNGTGMNGAELETLRSHMEQYSGEEMKIGLGNVYLRLRMFYKGAASLTIESAKNQGTKVTLRIPCGGIGNCRKQSEPSGGYHV